jgi:membrane protein DedA with SNARE-associated domain
VLFAAGLGAPIPEEVPVMAGGALAHQQVVRWWIALPVCFLGVLSGDVLLYWVGHHWGERILAWRVVRLVLSPEREAALLAGYRRHGLKIVFTARHVLGLRAAAFLTAGIARVPFTRFVAVDALAALVSVPVGFGLAYFFTDRVEALLRDVRRVEGWVVLAGLGAVVIALAVVSYRRNRRLAARGGPGGAGDGVL